MRHRLALGALVALAALTFTASAFAHARVSPPVGLAKQLQVFTLAVPTEKENATTTTIELTLPDGLLDRLVRAVAGLDAERAADGLGRRAPSSRR